jgi:hypothetical protein
MGRGERGRIAFLGHRLVKPVYQTIDDAFDGNCFSACVASIFEVALDSVPSFEGEDGEWAFAWNDWLRQYNLGMMTVEPRGPWEEHIHGFRIGIAPTGKGHSHAVVFEGMAFRHDPMPDGCTYEREQIEGWAVFYVLDPAAPHGIPDTGVFASAHAPKRARRGL